MVAFARSGLREKGHRLMSKKLKQAAKPITASQRPAPVRVRLKRINCDYAIPYPPDGQAREWWQRLKSALGTASSAFVEVSLHQLVAAARLPYSGISEFCSFRCLAVSVHSLIEPCFPASRTNPWRQRFRSARFIDDRNAVDTGP